MSNVEPQKGQLAVQLAVQRLKEKIDRLKEQQTAAEKMAALVGMTNEDSEQYRERHDRIRKLTRKLAVLEGKQGAHHEQKETQDIAGQGRKSAQTDASKGT